MGNGERVEIEVIEEETETEDGESRRLRNDQSGIALVTTFFILHYYY